jgi:hypothetical protein
LVRPDRILLPITRSAAVTTSLEADELAVDMITCECSRRRLLQFDGRGARPHNGPDRWRWRRRLGSSWSMSGYYRFDIPLCERDALRTAEDLQQHRDPFEPGHPTIDSKMPTERTRQDFDAIACL